MDERSKTFVVTDSIQSERDILNRFLKDIIFNWLKSLILLEWFQACI